MKLGMRQFEEVMRELEVLDFADISAVMMLMSDVIYFSHAHLELGFEFPEKEIVEIFRKNGFDSSVSKLRHDEADGNKMPIARCIIGGCLSCLERGLPIHSGFDAAIAEWQESFGSD
jgi:hypothetical protein